MDITLTNYLQVRHHHHPLPRPPHHQAPVVLAGKVNWIRIDTVC